MNREKTPEEAIREEAAKQSVFDVFFGQCFKRRPKIKPKKVIIDRNRVRPLVPMPCNFYLSPKFERDSGFKYSKSHEPYQKYDESIFERE